MANWLNEIRSESTPGDELAIFCLSNMYLRHVYVKTNKLFWTTVKHAWEDDDASIRTKCELFLMYLDKGKFAEYIPVVTPEKSALTLEDLSTNNCRIKPKRTNTKNPKPSKASKTPNTNSVTRGSRKKNIETLNDPNPTKRTTRNKRCINYADLNLGIESSEESSPPRKRKKSIAATLREPLQTVIAARNQRITRNSLQRSEYKHTSLIGTVIITPPAKEIKSEHQDSTVKTEKDWLSLPKNIPKENISLNDPHIHPRLIHKDGSICHSKTYWKSLKKKPPLKEFELPDLFSDDEELEIKGHNKSKHTEVTTMSNKTTGTKGHESNEPPDIENPKNVKEIMMTIEAPITKGNNVPTSVVTTKTDTKGESDKNNNMPGNSVNTDNVENSGDRRTPHPGKSPALNTDASDKTENPTNAELQERNITSSTSMTVDTEKIQEARSSDVTSVLEPNVTTEKTELPEGNDTPTTAMTVNTEKINNHENSRSIDVANESGPNVTTEETNDHEKSRSSDITSESEPNVTTEKTEESMTTRETDTQDKETSVINQTSSNQQEKTNPNEDWASLMFHSDDSLFDEMTKQIENNQNRSEPVTKEPTSMATQNFETLPDIVITQNKTEAATGLLMLSLNSNDIDAEIDNERDMPINPKAHNKDNMVDNDNKQNTQPKTHPTMKIK